MKEIIYYNLNELVVNKEEMSNLSSYDKWTAIPYETGKYKGTMVAAGEKTFPKSLVLDLKVKGWYKVYLGLISYTWVTVTQITINGVGTNMVEGIWPDWDPNEWLDEAYFMNVNFIDGLMTLDKPQVEPILSSGLAYVKLVEMTEEEIKEQTSHIGGVVNPHMDQDSYGHTVYKTFEDYSGPFNMLENFGGGNFYLETVLEGKVYGTGDKGAPVLNYIETRNKLEEEYKENHLEIRNKIIDNLHRIGYKVYSSLRFQVGDFFCPTVTQYNMTYAEETYPEYLIYTRDGRVVNTCSFAYKKIREEAVDSIIKSTKGSDFEGVQLFFHRGFFMGFEQPIKDYVMEHYNVDACLLPLRDKRLTEAYCYFMKDFMKMLRNALDSEFGKDKLKISVVGFYDHESSKQVGLDVEDFAKDGLINDVCQGLMSWDEEVDDILNSDGLIDLDKFKEKNSRRQVLVRHYDGDNTKTIVDGSIEYMNILNKYGCTYSATLGWSNADLRYTHNLASELKKVGVKGLYSWNMNHKTRNTNLFHTEEYISKHYNNLGERSDYSHRTRVLRFGGKDISTFNANWNG